MTPDFFHRRDNPRFPPFQSVHYADGTDRDGTVLCMHQGFYQIPPKAILTSCVNKTLV